MSSIGTFHVELIRALESSLQPGLLVDRLYGITKEYFISHNLEEIEDTILLSININNRVYHDRPVGILFKSGDVVTIDLCFRYRGDIIDGAITRVVGQSNSAVDRLIQFNKELLKSVLEIITPGVSVKTLLKYISDKVALEGYYLLPDGLGHGVGSGLHVKPFLSLNDFTDFSYIISREDRFTLEPVLLMYKESVSEDENGVGKISSDNVSSQFEVTITFDEKGKLLVLNGALLN